jgi:hypothetical protein
MNSKDKTLNEARYAEYGAESISVRRNSGYIERYSREHKKNYLIYFLFLFITFTISFLNYGQANHLVLYFQNKAGDKTLEADSAYQNSFGESFTVRTFRYYISNIVAEDISTGKRQSFPNEYFLVDNADTAPKQIELEITLKHISSFHFLLGIDSLKNVAGIQSGNLDPAKGMFWTWNTGYVMAKLEGNSQVAQTPMHAFSYHVGGYKQNEKTAREINFKLPHLVDCSGRNCTITIEADVLKWFNAVNEIKIADTPICHEPGVLATKLADNYSKMFSIADVQ